MNLIALELSLEMHCFFCPSILCAICKLYVRLNENYSEKKQLLNTKSRRKNKVKTILDATVNVEDVGYFK